MIVAVAYAVVFVLVVLTGFRRPSDRALALFSATFAVPITAETRPLVEGYIRGSRRFRLAGLCVSVLYAVFDEARTGTGNDELHVIALGYGVGAVMYELVRPTPAGGMAALERRRLRDYVSPGLVWLVGTWLVVAPVLFVAAVLAGTAPNVATERTEEWFMAVALLIAAAVGLALVTARRIVGSPQPLVSAGVDAAQHAIRSSGLIALMGLMLLACAWFGAASSNLVADFDVRGRGWIQLGGGLTVMFAGVPGLFLTFRSLPRFAPFWRSLPAIAPAGAAP